MNFVEAAFGKLIWAINEVLGIIPEDTKENVNFNQKSAKLMLRNRFSHTNLKKLSNANNI